MPNPNFKFFGDGENVQVIPVVIVDNASNQLALAEGGGIALPSGTRGWNYGRVLGIGTAASIDTQYVASSATGNGQRSIKSASANDTAAGTGIRTVKITYYDASMNGPFSETMTMNGTTAVATVNSDICYLEKMEAITAGSGGFAAGNITFWTNNNGTGINYGGILIGEMYAPWSHHYVGAGRTCYLQGLTASCSKAGKIRMHMINPVGNPTIGQITLAEFRLIANTSFYLPMGSFPVVGPAFINIGATPDGTASDYFALLDYIDQ